MTDLIYLLRVLSGLPATTYEQMEITEIITSSPVSRDTFSSNL